MQHIVIDFPVPDRIKALRAFLTRLLEPFPLGTLTDAVLDLSACGILGPAALATLGALQRRAARENAEWSLVLPSDQRAKDLLVGSGLVHIYRGLGQPKYVPGSQVCPTEQFRTLPVSAIDHIVDLCRLQLGLTSGGAEAIQLCVTELAQNVLDHSSSEVGGFLAARTIVERREVHFAVVDLGLGFRHSLGTKFRIASDVEAIRKALEPGVSGKSTNRNMGLGLDHIVEIGRRHKGYVFVISGSGRVLLDQSMLNFAQFLPPFPGTIACVQLHLQDDQSGGLNGGFEEDVWS